MKVIIRPVTKADQGIIMSTWLKGMYWGGCSYFGAMEQDLFFKEYSKHIQRIIDRPGTQIDCAVLEEAPETVLGYICYNDQDLYWAYTKRPYRKTGIFNTLMKHMDFTTFTGNTPVGLAIGKKKKLEYNPLKER